jgi:hypothetical protein
VRTREQPLRDECNEHARAGLLPTEFGQLSNMMYSLDINYNQLTGESSPMSAL